MQRNATVGNSNFRNIMEINFNYSREVIEYNVNIAVAIPYNNLFSRYVH